MADETAIRATLDRYCKAWEERNREAWLSAFSTQATQVDPVGTPVNSGHEGIGGFWDRVMALYSHIELRPTNLFICEDEAAMTWTIIGQAAGGWESFDGVDVFRFEPDGLVASVRAYWRNDLKRRHPARPSGNDGI